MLWQILRAVIDVRQWLKQQIFYKPKRQSVA